MLYGSPRVVQWHKLFVRHCFDVALAIIVRSISTHEQATENLVPLKLAHRHTRHQFFYLFNFFFCNGLLIFYQISFFFKENQRFSPLQQGGKVKIGGFGYKYYFVSACFSLVIEQRDFNHYIQLRLQTYSLCFLQFADSSIAFDLVRYIQ